MKPLRGYVYQTVSAVLSHPDARRCVVMNLLYTLCWLMICVGVLLIVGTLSYDVLFLNTFSVENARTAADVERDTWLILSGAGITTFSALTGMIVGCFVKPTVASAPNAEEAR
ncbi:MAG: hypothetical protein ACR2N1_15895 [Rubripirellula sp.]